MGRKNIKDRQFDTRLSMKRMCQLLGITPLERVKMTKQINKMRGNRV